VPLVTLLLKEGYSTKEEENAGSKDWTENTHPLDILANAGTDDEQPNPKGDLAKVVWMPRYFPQSHLTPLSFVGWIIPEAELLLVTDGLTQETNYKEDTANDIHGGEGVCAEEDSAPRGIDKDNRETDSEDPNSLEDPEHCKLHWVCSLIIKPVILPNLDDSVEKIPGEPETPGNYKCSHQNLPPVISSTQHKSQNGQNHKVCTTSKICDFVKLAGACNQEEGELHGHRHNRADAQVVDICIKHQHFVRLQVL